jgi:hypothetical protein
VILARDTDEPLEADPTKLAAFTGYPKNNPLPRLVASTDVARKTRPGVRRSDNGWGTEGMRDS